MASIYRVLIGFSMVVMQVPAEVAVRQVKKETPTPCKKEYDAELIAASSEKYLESMPANADTPRMLLLFGGSGSGKGTFIKKHLAKHGFPVKDYVWHGLDEYLNFLPEFRQSASDPNYIYEDAADGCYSGAIPIGKAVQKLVIERKHHVIYEETGKNLDRVLQRILPPFRDAGYVITLVLVDNTAEEGIRRAVGRFQREGRYSSPEYVQGTFSGVFDNYLKLRKLGLVHESVYCDNSCKDEASWECMKCWADSDPASSDLNSATPALVPRAALEQGSAQYMASRSSSKDDL
eukprot:gnl/TRDRNA2_/TRDRNA2_42039_c0_seq2.p1 gnl/TRDRNA2_/TRDRNA2_42039_c0~~gnl/TRDRNA2_/TRDRNA2_42039_c0_seq2.p1  ORF type:complete len:291 (-),score=56.50 gnl/TRDRNA2_/TRDRNA2_42039_c0_seq2:31-903(-)